MSTSAHQAKKGFSHLLDVEERDPTLNPPVQKEHLFKLFRAMFKYPGVFWAGMLSVGVGICCTLLEPRIFGLAIDEAIIPKNWNKLTQLTLFYFLVTAMRSGAVVAQGMLFELLGQRVSHDLRSRLFAHLQSLPMSLYNKNPAGRLLTRVTNDIAALHEMFSAGFVSMIFNILMVCGILAWLIALNFKLGLIAGAVFPVLMVAAAFFSRKLRIAYRAARSRLSALNAFLAENISGMRVVHLFNREAIQGERYARINQWYSDAQMSTIRIFSVFHPTITASAGLSMALVIWFGAHAVLDREIPLGILVAYFSYVFALFQPVREIADKWNVFLAGMAAAERVFSVFGWEREPNLGTVLSRDVRGHIVFENVWFAYEDQCWILKDLSFEVHPGERVGIVGHTGAGKTTLIALLLGFYRPQKGRILLDGIDLREYELRSLRACFGVVQQDPFLFAGTLEENLGFWGEVLPSAGGAALKDVFGARLQEGAFRLRERGINLSVGERQMVAFARALAQSPKIWVLDEATANVDSESEAAMSRVLGEETRDKTLLIVAHRLSTVRDAHQILVLNKGCLMEKGTHESLCVRQGLYARMVRYQQLSEARF
ncbi:ABC transporter ATP-binding protein [Bdellovibrionota bacterium FG-2]